MKFRTERQSYTAEHTIDGVTVPITKRRDIRVPILPRNWNGIAVRAAVGLVLTLTMISVVWSTASIGSLLGGGIGFGAAVVFDFAWAVCLLLEYLARFDQEKRAFPIRLGWALLVATMGAIFWHGWVSGSIPMAVAGASVSAVAKVLWLGIMKYVNRDLSPEDAQWVAAQISAANATAAVADARRNAARIEQRAALELLAMEREQATIAEAFGLPARETAPALETVADAPEDAESISASAPVAELLAGITPEQLAAALALLGQTQATAVADAPDIEEEELLPALQPPTLSHLSKADAIRVAIDRRPDSTPVQIANLLSGYDVNVSADYVRQVQSRDRDAALAAAVDTDTEREHAGAVVQIRKAK
ncbi:MAG: hypothetical protein JWO67_4125 [Streptosporangiaceae bacterium]|nr:hypothetical protein [Streptosporangiaceae bacterium]